jgi:peptidoglycan hydrolase CwlO-like protein
LTLLSSSVTDFVQLEDGRQNGLCQIEELTQALQEREERITELDHERRYALDGASRLEDDIRERDVEVVRLSERVSQYANEAEQLREKLSTVGRDHDCVVDTHSRELQRIASRDGETRQQMETLIREKAESDTMLSELKEQVCAFKAEVERLRRQVHDLQQESADKEVKIVQLTKGRAQIKEDMEGLNIALDSKQQELELVNLLYGTPSLLTLIPYPCSSSVVSTFVGQEAAHQPNLQKLRIIETRPYFLLPWCDRLLQCQIQIASESPRPWVQAEVPGSIATAPLHRRGSRKAWGLLRRNRGH